MKMLFLFLDGVGLGTDDPQVNPFLRASMPHLDGLLGGYKLVTDGHHQGPSVERIIQLTNRATLLPLDACLAVDGNPQSASGQASLLTGKNVAEMLGYHDGPKPNPLIMEFLKGDTLFSRLRDRNRRVSLLNAYPPRYFESIESGHRLPGVVALAARYAGLKLKTVIDLQHDNAISADFTAKGWHDHLGLLDTPLLSPRQAGERLMNLANGNELAFFEYWLTDVVGHHQDMQSACDVLELFDEVLGSLVELWDDEAGLILVTSDHGNLEDLGTRHHTRNDVPLLLIGAQELREQFIQEMTLVSGPRNNYSLTDITPSIVNLI